MSELHYPIGMALQLVLQEGVLLFRITEPHQATKLWVRLGQYPTLSWKTGYIQSIENHLLVGCSLITHKLSCKKLSGSEGNSWVSCIWTPDTPFSAENEGGHEHWPRTICISGCCIFGSAFYLFYSVSSRARQGLQKKNRKTNLPFSICSYAEVNSLYASLLLKAQRERAVVLLAWPSVWGWELRVLPSPPTGFLLCPKLNK